MNRGYVHLWRKSLDSGWIKNHKLWAFWSYCLLKATHREYDAIVGRQVIHLKPGQFIFGRQRAAEETGLSEREIRTILDLLKRTGTLTIKTTNKYSIITIVNWGTYQGGQLENDHQNDHQNDQQMTSKRPHTSTITQKYKNPGEILSQVSELTKRYQDQDIIARAFQAITSTRKSNRIADSVKLRILQDWDRYPVASVIQGIKTYLRGHYADRGKNERYLLGIIRNNNGAKAAAKPQGNTMKSTRSSALNNYYRKKGFTIS